MQKRMKIEERTWNRLVLNFSSQPDAKGRYTNQTGPWHTRDMALDSVAIFKKWHWEENNFLKRCCL